MKIQKNLKSQIVTSSWGGRSDEEFSNWKSQIVMSNDNLNLKSQFATSEKWDSLRSQNVTIEGRCGGTYGLKNHREHRVHREKLHRSVLSVYSVVEKLYSNSLFQEKLKSLGIEWR